MNDSDPVTRLNGALEGVSDAGGGQPSRERLFEGELQGGPGSFAATYDVHPDGERFVLARETGGGTEIVVWLDWLDELKARMRN